MTISQMRAAVHEAYSGNGWGKKVDNMSDIQVQAIYFSLLERGLFDKLSNKKQSAPEPKKTAEGPTFEPPAKGEQMTFF